MIRCLEIASVETDKKQPLDGLLEGAYLWDHERTVSQCIDHKRLLLVVVFTCRGGWPVVDQQLGSDPPLGNQRWDFFLDES